MKTGILPRFLVCLLGWLLLLTHCAYFHKPNYEQFVFIQVTIVNLKILI